MTRDQLEHAIRAACEIANDRELIVFGSQAILGTYSDPPESASILTRPGFSECRPAFSTSEMTPGKFST